MIKLNVYSDYLLKVYHKLTNGKKIDRRYEVMQNIKEHFFLIIIDSN